MKTDEFYIIHKLTCACAFFGNCSWNASTLWKNLMALQWKSYFKKPDYILLNIYIHNGLLLVPGHLLLLKYSFL